MCSIMQVFFSYFHNFFYAMVFTAFYIYNCSVDTNAPALFFSGAGAFCGREAASGVVRSFSSALFEYYCFMRLSACKARVIWKEKYINVKRF